MDADGSKSVGEGEQEKKSSALTRGSGATATESTDGRALAPWARVGVRVCVWGGVGRVGRWAGGGGVFLLFSFLYLSI
jgi:hypothetical protein